MSEKIKAEASTENEKSGKRAKKSGKPPFGKRVANFFKEYRSEMKKVVWCPFADVKKNTGIVSAALAIAGVAIGVIDLALTQLILLLGRIG